MTLFKQITLILSLFFLIILTTIMILIFQSSNQSVQDRLYQDAKNTATYLSLSLGTTNGDIPTISTMINANFDIGNYAYISLTDVDNKIIYERKSENDQISVPKWFINAIQIEAPLAVANVSAGWTQIGILKVKSDVSYAYAQLYTIFKNILISFIIIAFITLMVLNILLANILKPLKMVQKQAEAITHNKFILQKTIPKTIELKDVVIAMNQMVEKVQLMLDKANKELQYQKQLAYIDSITGLKNRKYFVNKLPQYLKLDAESKGGANILISLNGAQKANQQIGRKNVDSLFIAIANCLKKYTSNYHDAMVIRMNGTEFSVFLPDCTDAQALKLANNINDSLMKLIQKYKLDTNQICTSIGIYTYNHTQTIQELLSHSDDALAQAKFTNKVYLEKAEDAPEVMGKEAWKSIITKAIEKNYFHLVPCNVINTQTKEILYKVLTITLTTNKNITYSYGKFMASAHQIGLSNKIYDHILNIIFTKHDTTLNNSVSSLRLSYHYVRLSTTYDKMAELFKNYADKLPFKLIIGMPDKFVNKNSEQVRKYKKLFEKYNIGMGIFEFIGESADYTYLQDLRPIYIKGAPEYFISQNKETISALKNITDTLNISLIATGVTSMEQVNKLQEKEIYIIQGKVVDELL